MFLNSEMMRSAVVQKLPIIGEVAARLPEPLKKLYAEVPWPQIVAFRSILMHAYFEIEREEMRRSAKNRIFREQVARIIAAPGGPPAENDPV